MESSLLVITIATIVALWKSGVLGLISMTTEKGTSMIERSLDNLDNESKLNKLKNNQRIKNKLDKLETVVTQKELDKLFKGIKTES